MAAQPSNWTVLFSDDFEGGAGDAWGVLLQDNQARGWFVETEGTNHVFAGHGNAKASLTTGRWFDFRLKARVRILQGSLYLHYRSSECAGYYVSLDPGAITLTRWRPCGTRVGLARTAGSYGAGRWYTVEIVGIGANLKVYVDGALTIDFTDPDPTLFGTVAVETMPDSDAALDDIEVVGPPESPQPVWVKTGGPLGGVGYDVRMRPDNPDRMFVTDTFSGVNMSADGGRTWHASNKGITSRVGISADAIPVFCLTIDPHNPDVIWIGTQGTRAIFKSVDGGKTWVQKDRGINEPLGTAFRGFAIDPRTSDIVYAAAEGPPLGSGKASTLAAGVVYRTTNGGESWQVAWRGDSLARYILINPENPDVVYVSTGIFDREAINSKAAQNVAGGVGILKSVDGGRTWRALNQSNGLQNLYVSSLFMHPQNPNILLAAAGNFGYSEGSGAYLSTDGGEHWEKTLSASQLGQNWDPVTSVEFAVSGPRIAYAGSQTTFWRSADGGRTWTVMSGGPPAVLYYGPPGTMIGKPIDLQVDPRNPDRVFANNYGGGNFLTEDGGATWVIASTGYTGAEVWMVAIDSGDPRRVFANAKSGPFRSDDGGANWRGIQFPPMMLDVQGGLALDPADPARVLLGDMNSGEIFRSTTGGRSWDLVFQETRVNRPCMIDDCNGFRAFAFAPSSPNVVYAGMRRQILSIDARNPGTSFGVYRSIDRGETWAAANDAQSARQDVNALAVDPHSADVAYAGTVAGGVLRTRDGGKSWAAVSQGLPLMDVRSLTIDPANPSILYAGLERGGLFKTTDGGDHWLRSGYGMDPQASVRALAIDPTNSKVVYAGDALTGVYRSRDAGQTWQQLNQGLRTRAVMALAISSDGGTLYAATAGEGVFRLDIKLNTETTLNVVSAASFLASAALAPESIATLFGQGLSAATESAASSSLPTILAGTTVVITDADGNDRRAPLFFVSPGQINCLIPSGLKSGSAEVRVFRDGRVVTRGQVRIAPVAPGLFAANANGRGAPAAVAIRVAADGAQTPVAIFACGTAPGSCAPVPIDLGPDTDQVILVLFGTGIRGYSSLSAVSARIGGLDAPVLYAGPQGQYVGLDQVNVRVPRSVVSAGEVPILLSVEGKPANIVTVAFR